jgi:hypothetical protein
MKRPKVLSESDLYNNWIKSVEKTYPFFGSSSRLMLAVDKECPLRSEKAKLDDAKIIASTLLRAVDDECGGLTSYQKVDIAQALGAVFNENFFFHWYGLFPKRKANY